MDPCYMDNYEFDSLSIAPIQHKKSCEIKVGPHLLRLVNLLCIRKELGSGGVQFGRLCLKGNQVNT